MNSCFVLYKFLFFLSDFLQVQTKSFYRFLNFQFGENLTKVNIPSLFKFRFLGDHYKFIKPYLNIEQSILKSKTYCCNFYVPVQFHFLDQFVIKWLFLGTLPLLTRRGHFIINGTPRIVLNQIVRSAGIYFHQHHEQNIYYSEIVFHRGPWVRLEIDYQKKIWICFHEMPKMHLNTFINNFQNQVHLELGKIGRHRFNKKLNICSTNSPMLTPLDLVAVSHVIYNLPCSTSTNCLVLQDDIDDLQNRRLNTIGDLLQNQLIRGLVRLENFFNKKNKKFDQIINTKTAQKYEIFQNLIKASDLNCSPINSCLKEFFHSHQLSQYLDQTNPLSQITHQRRLSCLGSGGISNETAGMKIRGIHRTHYGRICPIETPEGQTAGLVNSLTTGVQVDSEGFLKTPFVDIYRQHVQNHKRILFYDVQTQIAQNVFFSSNLKKSKNLFVAVIKSQTQTKCSVYNIDLLGFNTQQFLSIGTTCIPFVEHDDANRALMGSNMQRQALPLLHLEQPIVNTLNCFRVISDLKDVALTAISGIITYVSCNDSSISYQKSYESIPLPKSNLFWLEKIFFKL